MQEFLVKYAHKYAQKLTKLCKNVLKYALNMQKIFSIWNSVDENISSKIFRVVKIIFVFSVNFKSFG